MTPYYEEPGITIYRADCRDVLPYLPKVDLVLTDPPYGVELGIEKDMRRNGHGLGKTTYASYVDNVANLRSIVVPAIVQAIERCGRGLIFSGPMIWEYPPSNTIGGIYCPSGVGRHCWGFNTFFPVLFYGSAPDLHNGARGGTILQSAAIADANGHPCPKPVEWMNWLVQRGSLPNDTILDPFMGSGTTLVAAKQLGRKAIGIEIERKYCDIAIERLRQEVLPFTALPEEPVAEQLLLLEEEKAADGSGR